MNNTIVELPNGDFEVLTEVEEEEDDTILDDEPEHLIARGACEACDGDLKLIGYMGNKKYYRCQSCKRIF